MKAKISESIISGRLAAPSSKSYTLRALACAALAEGQSTVAHPLVAEDTLAMREVLASLGTNISDDASTWRVKGGRFTVPSGDLFCHDSAGTLRFMMALCALAPGTCLLTAAPALSRRPVGPLAQALNDLGVRCISTDGCAPVMVRGGQFKGGEVSLPGNVSSQFISALLFIGPCAEQGLTVKLTSPPQSRPYLQMTLQCLEKFGVQLQSDRDLHTFLVLPQAYRATTYNVEGDWSSASYLLALGAIAGETTVTNLNAQSLQADRELLNLMQKMGAQIEISEQAITVKQASLKALTADLTDCIDLLPTMAILAASAEGVSELRGISRARIKESDRVAAVAEELGRMDIEVKVESDSLRIRGGRPKGAAINPRGDHRIAMAFGILGVLAGNTVIEDAGCVAKTYPRYWDDLIKLGGKVVINEQ